MNVNTEALEYTLTDWARNLYMYNNRDRATDPKSTDALRREFNDFFYGKNSGRGLSKAAQLSEQAFTLYCYANAFVPRVIGNAATNNGLVNAWRRAVFKNSFQQRYSKFEECLKQTLSQENGWKKAVAAYPDTGFTGNEIAFYLQSMNYKPKLIDTVIVATIIEDAGKPTPPPAPKPPKR